VVIFDVGGVLCHGVGRLEALATAAGAPYEAIDRAYWESRDAYDRGASDVQYWTRVLDTAGVQSSPALIHELDRIDCASWSSLDHEAAEILSCLREAGVPTAILSNAPHALAETLRLSPWRDLVPRSYFSCELGTAKPDPAIYRLVAEDLAIDPAGLLFFDDRSVNVAAACSQGWRAHVYESADNAIRVLRQANVL
jgi:putative hydrolase of the HAD superfamily